MMKRLSLALAFVAVLSGAALAVPQAAPSAMAFVFQAFLSVGGDTAVNIAMEAIDRLHSTAESHHRIMVVEVMGRHAGWIAIHSAIAGGADLVLIPEVPIHMDEVITS